ncbi:hypothetical protein KJ980_08040 [Patescibacteria group bacterium]|nr:hypothetical protein [Patescibacteria group bacterium]MBU4016493.1 hypothetical protein [Patescibacteria group bacterium]MBU4099568.1 hypothetical protein [Patescibacteria group bacterium]
MNKKNLIMFAVLILAVVGIIVFYSFPKYSSKTQIVDQKTRTESQIDQSNTGNKIEATLKSLLSNGKSLKCTFSSDSKDYPVRGTVYTGNGKVRQDFQSNAGGMTIHLIVDNSNSYMWTDGDTQGFKFAIDQAPTVQPSNGFTQSWSQSPDINKSMNFSCQDWRMDNSLFTLPSNVTFQSFTMPPGPSVVSGISITSSPCGVCDNLPSGEARNSCRTQLNCQ